MKREFRLAWLAETGLSGLPEVQSSAGGAEDAMRALLASVREVEQDWSLWPAAASWVM